MQLGRYVTKYGDLFVVLVIGGISIGVDIAVGFIIGIILYYLLKKRFMELQKKDVC